VRSLPAAVRAGVASLQQIDHSIEKASAVLEADAQYTFRKVTLPLTLPAIVAGLIFSFTRHMTSLSAIIFLVSPRWRIVTASILSEWEQGGISMERRREEGCLGRGYARHTLDLQELSSSERQPDHRFEDFEPTVQ